MKKLLLLSAFLIIAVVAIISCGKKVDTYSEERIDQYYTAQVGKFIRYRLDSLKFTAFGARDTTIYYEAKDVVESANVDNSGRPGWTVVRYLRDTLGQTPWRATMTYVVTPTREALEVVEENFRFEKMKLPVKNGITWKGNKYISLNSSDPNWNYDYFFDWNYTYENTGLPFPIFNGEMVQNTVTVNQVDETLGNPADDKSYSERTYGKEVYAKDIGLVYREFMHYTYQVFYVTANCYYTKCVNNVCDTIYCNSTPTRCDSVSMMSDWKKTCRDSVITNSYYEGAGIRLTMIDHN
ncbi:MAG: hypothetical protein ABW036_00075 [Flavitalea sp.]